MTLDLGAKMADSGCCLCGVTESAAQPSRRSIRPQHEAVKIRRKLGMAIEREDMRDILVRPHHDHAAFVPIDAAHRKDVVAAFQVGAEHLLVVAKPVTSFRREQERGHGCDGELRMRLLEHRTDIDH